MFEDLKEAVEWAKKAYPGCSFSVKEQEDGPTVVSIRQTVREEDRIKIIRAVVYVRKSRRDDNG